MRKGLIGLAVAVSAVAMVAHSAGMAQHPVPAAARPAAPRPLDPVTVPMVAATASPDEESEGGPSLPDGGPLGALPPVVMLPPIAGADGLMPPEDANTAPVALLVDLSSGRVLFARDAARPFLPASVTKTMTAFVAMEMLASGKVHPDTRLTVSHEAWAEWHAKGSRMFLGDGQQVSVDDLLKGIMTVSANDGCVVLAQGLAGSVPAWVALMNDAARRLGMTDSHFGTPNGWMDHGHTRISARDLVRLADAMTTRYPELYHRYVGRKGLSWNGIAQVNHDPTLGLVEGADGIKTGFTNEAHYNFLGSAVRGGRRLVVVLAGVPTAKARAKAAKALLDWGFSAYTTRPLLPAGARIATADVQGGTAASVPLVTPRAFGATLANGTHARVTMQIHYLGPLVAPVAKGVQVAELEIRTGKDAPVRLPLVAGETVAKGTAWDRLRAGLAHLAAR